MTSHQRYARACAIGALLLGAGAIACYHQPIPAAGLAYGAAFLAWCASREHKAHRRALEEHEWARHLRAVVAVATLASCHESRMCCQPWGFPGTWHWVLEDVRPIPNPPRPIRGQLGLWTVDDDVLAAVNWQVYITERFGL